MKILFYLAAGNGDLINFTGVLRIIKLSHINYQLDILIPKKHLPLIANHPAISNILFIEDYPNIPIHCTHERHDTEVAKTFKGKYNHILNAWGCKIQSENDGDYAKTMFNLMKQYGFVLPFERADIHPVFYYDFNDYSKINEYSKLINKPLILLENESRSWDSPQKEYLPDINNYLKNNGYMTAGNGNEFDINLFDFNLKQCKLLFDTCGKGFLGLSSGMTCAIYAKPNDYINKLVCVSGIYDGWNLSKHVESKYTYKYFYKPYKVEDIKLLFKEIK